MNNHNSHLPHIAAKIVKTMTLPCAGEQLGGDVWTAWHPLYDAYQTKNKLKTIDCLTTRTTFHPPLQSLSNQKE